MQYLKNTAFVTRMIEQMTGPRNTCYTTHDLYKHVAELGSMKCQSIQIGDNDQPEQKTPQTQPTPDPKLRIFLIQPQTPPQPHPCIIYLHGYTSYCLESEYLLPHLKAHNFSLAMYDQRGHGKNCEGGVTFGVREAEDLRAVVRRLVGLGVREVVLWGRSMGAATVINFVNKFVYCCGDGDLPDYLSAIKYIILDSPYISLQQATKQLAYSLHNIPKFVTNTMLPTILKKMQQTNKISLSQLEFPKTLLNTATPHPKSTTIPLLFIYSQQDKIIPCSHTKQLMQCFNSVNRMLQPGRRFRYLVLRGSFQHNQVRSGEIVERVLAAVELERGREREREKEKSKGMGKNGVGKEQKTVEKAKYYVKSDKQNLYAKNNIDKNRYRHRDTSTQQKQPYKRYLSIINPNTSHQPSDSVAPTNSTTCNPVATQSTQSTQSTTQKKLKLTYKNSPHSPMSLQVRFEEEVQENKEKQVYMDLKAKGNKAIGEIYEEVCKLKLQGNGKQQKKDKQKEKKQKNSNINTSIYKNLNINPKKQNPRQLLSSQSSYIHPSPPTPTVEPTPTTIKYTQKKFTVPPQPPAHHPQPKPSTTTATNSTASSMISSVIANSGPNPNSSHNMHGYKKSKYLNQNFSTGNIDVNVGC